MILMSSMSTILFLGGWLPPFDIDFFQNIPGFIWFLLKVSFFETLLYLRNLVQHVYVLETHQVVQIFYNPLKLIILYILRQIQ